MPELKLKAAVSTGLFTIAHPEDLATVIRKVGYGLTRGTSAIEIAGDIPHEIDYTEGKEIRSIAEKQGVDLNLHGSLTIPFEIPEMVQFREAQDHVQKSLKSAVYGGCHYVDFHACLHFWVEMLTYVGARLEIIMCDWKGRFISEILYENDKLRKLFIEKYWDKYDSLILGEDIRAVYYRSQEEATLKARDLLETGQITEEELGVKIGEIHKELLEKYTKEELEKKMSNPLPEKRDWYHLGKLRGDYVDACWLIANYLFLVKDPIWEEMIKMYKDLMNRYKYDPNDDYWLYNAWKKAEDTGDREFKEFYYGTVSAKFLQGHLMLAAQWMSGTGIFKEQYPSLPKIIENELKMMKVPNFEEEYNELMGILKNIHIAIENPDARDPREAGRYMLWKSKQIYVAIKQTREELKKEGNPYWDKMMMLIDFEHIATQGIDPNEELADLVKNVPDVGKYIKCIHSNYPSPMHSHWPIELGDDRIYRLLWILKEAELGKHHTTYILFERGGFKDPFMLAVTALKLMIKFLEENVPPEKLPDEFYGVAPHGILSEERQWATIYYHAMDPLKGTLKVPEEEYTFLGRAAVEAGKRPEEWKKEELR
ncbi:MAG: hypothetical protein QMD36_04510 [Candidatus Aenigmarchaeota archaeon]|nr:hypothetical protein [Candidatus Aenigmarchaeota archaeon]